MFLKNKSFTQFKTYFFICIYFFSPLGYRMAHSTPLSLMSRNVLKVEEIKSTATSYVMEA